jgi:hypothetical protein
MLKLHKYLIISPDSKISVSDYYQLVEALGDGVGSAVLTFRFFLDFCNKREYLSVKKIEPEKEEL